MERESSVLLVAKHAPETLWILPRCTGHLSSGPHSVAMVSREGKAYPLGTVPTMANFVLIWILDWEPLEQRLYSICMCTWLVSSKCYWKRQKKSRRKGREEKNDSKETFRKQLSRGQFILSDLVFTCPDNQEREKKAYCIFSLESLKISSQPILWINKTKGQMLWT